MGENSVVIVGAGPTGALLGIELARRGASVRILEQLPTPPLESRAGGIQSRTLELFERLGIVDELLSLGNRVTAMNFYSDLKRILRVDLSHLGGPFPFMLQVPQFETQRVLDRCLEGLGVRVERGVEVTEVEQDSSGVRLETTAGPLFASFVAGCDGAHSVVRHRLGIPFEGETYDWVWLGADVTVDWPFPESETHIFASSHGVLACLPYGGGRWRLFTPGVQDAGAELEALQELAALRGPAGMSISQPTWLGTFRASRRSAPRYRVGRAFLAGDAVHIHSPAAGQGMNTGLGDAENLGWKLGLVATGRAPVELLDSYELERAPVARSVIAFTHRVLRTFDSRVPLRGVRDLALPVVSANRLVQKRLAGRWGQHALSYSGGPLTAGIPGRRRAALRPGDRASDIPHLRHEGKPVRLFEVLRGPGHTVLWTGKVPAPQVAGRFGSVVSSLRLGDGRAPGTLLDPSGELRRRYRLSGGRACVIRPDGYVGYMGPATGVAGYLSRCLAPSAAGRAELGSVEQPPGLWEAAEAGPRAPSPASG